MDVNLGVAFRLSRALWLQLSTNDGAIINLASFASKRSTLFGNNSSYVAAKHGIAGLTRASAYEGATQGVRVNAIAPGVVDTDLIRSVHNADTRKKIMGFIPQNRFADPSEIADLALFLASNRARHICGEVVNINGGLCMD
jgi:3-oxoacyl-[acyl-carrier protein] reductase